MTPRLRTQCAITVASLLLLATPHAYADEESETSDRTPTARPNVSASLAGRHAGEGRPRPGRSPRSTSPSESESPDRPVRPDHPDHPDHPDRQDHPDRPHRTPSDAASASHSAPSDTRLSASEPPPTEDEELQTEEQEDPQDSPIPTPTPSVPAAAHQQAPQAVPEVVGHQISPLSLGAGMTLMGLGIGFLGVRLRRR
ncbi:hypothetical protein AB0D12_05925 [Streptomyces sp. NPDC048479]|uniref:hypothetical protein n=1 Tax=Streptomyces sp. NPDC048479 TaxID=3154725 RepID=UPI003446A0B5